MPAARRNPMSARPNFGSGLINALGQLEAKTGYKLTPAQKIIPDDMTFRQWAEALGAAGLKVDGKPFSLKNRPAMAWIYDQIPVTRAEAFRKVLVLMKCAQVGFTVMEMLATIYLGLKFSPCTIGMFLPDQNLADIKSSKRFMPIIRTVPKAHALMTSDDAAGGGKKKGEGNVRTRQMGDCLFVFSWTSGRATTESIPMDVLSFDEVQEMTLAQMEKTRERLSDSSMRYTIMGSTANWPDLDIHYWYKLGTQYKFHTRCPTCGAAKPLDGYFPECIRWDDVSENPLNGRPGLYRYVCENGHWLDDPQHGDWVSEAPENSEFIKSIHFPQFLSPSISPDEIMEKYTQSTDKKNFYNRVLGKPFLDPTQIPVTMEHMAACVAAGAKAGVQWKTAARGAFMGIDQMGQFNVVIIKERLPDGRQATIHVEMIYSEDPFDRCGDLMDQYGIAACVVEINPNFNDAHRFAKKFPGRVFLCNGFGELPDDMVKWGDAPKLDVSERRTDENSRTRYTVKCDQFKCMQTSLARFTAKAPACLWPDPQGLFQDVLDHGKMQRMAVAPIAFTHFTKTALVAEKVVSGGEKEATTNQYRRRVKKVGIDPHFSYANQLCDVAWARAHGTAQFIMPATTSAEQDLKQRAAEMEMHGIPTPVVGMMEKPLAGKVCGRCEAFKAGTCTARNLLVGPADVGCDFFIADEYAVRLVGDDSD